MNYKSCLVVRTVCNVLAILAAVAVLILPRTVFPEGLGVWSHVLLIGALVLVLAGAVVKAVFYRCPHCGEFLPVKGKTPDDCPHCGESLK